METFSFWENLNTEARKTSDVFRYNIFKMKDKRRKIFWYAKERIIINFHPSGNMVQGQRQDVWDRPSADDPEEPYVVFEADQGGEVHVW